MVEDRWIMLQSWHDRWRNWREERADRRAEREEWRRAGRTGPAQRIFSGAIGPKHEPERVQAPAVLAALFGRRSRKPEVDPVDEIPAFQRAAQQPAEASPVISRHGGQHLGA